MQIMYQYEIEFTEESFAELTDVQKEAYVRKEGEPTEKVYRLLPLEPQVIDRQGNARVTIELPIVTESEKQLLLDAVEFVYHGTRSMNEEEPTFQQRLDYMRPRLPPILTGSG